MASAQELNDRSSLRQALESHTARLFATNASSQERAALRKKAKEFDRELRQWRKTPGTSAPAPLVNLHFELHLDVARAAGVESIQVLLERERLHLFQTLPSHLESAAHSNLAATLASGSPDEAATRMLEHVQAEAPPMTETTPEAPRWRTPPTSPLSRRARKSK